MEKIRKFSEEREATPSGIFMPARNITDLSSRSKMSFLDGKQKAEQIEALYSRHGLVIPPNSYLANLINNAKIIWSKYILDELEIQMGLKFVHFNRIADAIIPLSHESNTYKYLKPLLSDTVDFFKRQESYAKNILWEIEVWSQLKRKMSNVYLQEPDIMVDFINSKVSIACKKIYS